MASHLALKASNITLATTTTPTTILEGPVCKFFRIKDGDGDTPFTPIAIIIKSIKTYMRKSDSIKLHRTAADPREKTEN